MDALPPPMVCVVLPASAPQQWFTIAAVTGPMLKITAATTPAQAATADAAAVAAGGANRSAAWWHVLWLRLSMGRTLATATKESDAAQQFIAADPGMQWWAAYDQHQRIGVSIKPAASAAWASSYLQSIEAQRK